MKISTLKKLFPHKNLIGQNLENKGQKIGKNFRSKTLLLFFSCPFEMVFTKNKTRVNVWIFRLDSRRNRLQISVNRGGRYSGLYSSDHGKQMSTPVVGERRRFGKRHPRLGLFRK